LRNLTSGNKKIFAMFAIIIIVIIILLIVCLSFVTKVEKKEYKVNSSTLLYDSEYNPIDLESDAMITKKWDNNYYLKTEDKNTEYKLGTEVVSYDYKKLKISLYGKIYKVFMDGKVDKLSDESEIANLIEDGFYKLADRKYLVVGNSIKNQTGTVNTKNYLIIILDKSGNTLLLNNELNSKTIKPMIIQTETFKFDVPNEKLITENQEIDLKKIIGSTNEYVEKEKKEENNENEVNNATNIENVLTEESQVVQSNNGNSQTIINNSQNTQVNNNQTQSNINIGSINTSNNSSTNKTPLAKSVSLRSVDVKSSYMDVEYAILDPENKYQTVYILVEGESADEQTIALDKNATKYRVTNLQPNKEYKITLGYKEILEDNTVNDVIEDMLTVRTGKINSTLEITKVRANKVYFNFKMDPDYIFESGKIALYVDGEKIDEVDIDINSSISSKGWNSNMVYGYGNEISLKLESAMYNGEIVNTNIETKLRNY